MRRRAARAKEGLAHADPAGDAADPRPRNPCDPSTDADCGPPPGATGYSIGAIMRFKEHRDPPT
jgi:hypothetical protein